jgi:hypothetical protein
MCSTQAVKMPELVAPTPLFTNTCSLQQRRRGQRTSWLVCSSRQALCPGRAFRPQSPGCCGGGAREAAWQLGLPVRKGRVDELEEAGGVGGGGGARALPLGHRPAQREHLDGLPRQQLGGHRLQAPPAAVVGQAAKHVLRSQQRVPRRQQAAHGSGSGAEVGGAAQGGSRAVLGLCVAAAERCWVARRCGDL